MLICSNEYSFPCACHWRATTRIGNDKALWTTAVSSPGLLTVLEAAGFRGLWMVYESCTTAWAHGPRRRPRRKEPPAPWRDGWQDAAFSLCARTSSSLRPLFSSLKPCFASSAFCCEPMSFVHEWAWLATRILHQRQKVLHKFGAQILHGWGRAGSFLRWTQTASVSAQNKKKQPHSSLTIKLECKEDQALAVTATLAKVKQNSSVNSGRNYHQLVQCFLPGSRRTQMSTSSSVKISSFRITLLLWTQPPLLLLQVYLSPCIRQHLRLCYFTAWPAGEHGSLIYLGL